MRGKRTKRVEGSEGRGSERKEDKRVEGSERVEGNEERGQRGRGK